MEISRYIPSYIARCNFWSMHLIQALPTESSVMHSDRRKHVHATPRAISSKSFWLAKSLLSMQIHSTWFEHLRQNRSRAHVDLIATTNIFKQGFPPETLITLTNKMKNQSVSIRRISNMECVLGYKVNKFTQFHPHLILAHTITPFSVKHVQFKQRCFGKILRCMKWPPDLPLNAPWLFDCLECSTARLTKPPRFKWLAARVWN